MYVPEPVVKIRLEAKVDPMVLFELVAHFAFIFVALATTS